MNDDDLHDFKPRRFMAHGQARTVYVAGSGPAVIVLHEMPGITPQVARFARWVRDAGLTVWLPSLFGRDGAEASAEEAIAVFRRTCIAAEFRALDGNGDTPVVRWLRALAHEAHAACGGPGVGAVGMCFTGHFALSLVLDAPTIAPVVCQPSMPTAPADALALPPSALAAIRERLQADDLTVPAWHFAGDHWCTAARMAAYQAALGPRFVIHVLPDAAANPDPPPFFRDVVASPHSVVTAHLVDAAGEPTRQAADAIVAHLRERLIVRGAVQAAHTAGR